MNDDKTELTEGAYYKVDVDDIMSTADNQKDKFDNLINQRISRFEVQGEIKSRFVIKQYDLTGYMLHILMKVTETLYLSVCQIPNPIRAYLKILADSIVKNKSDI